MRGCKENKSLYPGTPGTILSRIGPDWFSPAGSKPRSLVLILGHNLDIYRILTAWGWCTDCSDRTRNWELILRSFSAFLRLFKSKMPYSYPWQLYLFGKKDMKVVNSYFISVVEILKSLLTRNIKHIFFFLNPFNEVMSNWPKQCQICCPICVIFGVSITALMIGADKFKHLCQKKKPLPKIFSFLIRFKQWMKYANKLVYKDNIQVVYLPSFRVLAT